MNRLKYVLMAAFVLIGLAVQTSSVSAQSSAALSIVPRKNYTIEAGKSINDTLTIRNIDTESTLFLSLRVVDFSFLDDSGAPKLMLDEDAPQTTWSLKPFMTVPKSVSIPPNSSQTLDMNVTIPAGHGAGTYYSAIVYSSASAEGGNVGLSASGVTLVFTSIPGDVKEDLKLEKFGAYRTAAKGSEAKYTSFSTAEPLHVAFTLKNEGNVTEAPVGSITLKHLFGKEYIVNDINPSKSLALIGQTRTFSTCIKQSEEKVEFDGTTTAAKKCVSPRLWPGRYAAALNVFYGQNGNETKEVVGATAFWYMPVWFIIILLAIIGFVTYKIMQFKAGRNKKAYSPLKKTRRR